MKIIIEPIVRDLMLRVMNSPRKTKISLQQQCPNCKDMVRLIVESRKK